MARVLIVAYYFPPLGGIGSLRALGHASYLPDHGWETVVVAPRTGAYHRDEQLRFPEERVVRTGSLELSRVGKRALRTGGDDVRSAEVGRVRGAARFVARHALYFPDAQVGWAPFALAAGRRALRGRPVDAIISSSFPVTAHVVARRLARRARVPWIAEFRDPWSEMLPHGVQRTRAARLERSLARDADALVMTSPTWAQRHAELWRRPVEVIPNGHDHAQAPSEVRPPGLVLAYLGTYYAETQASLAPVWAAAREVGVDEIRIVGELHPAMHAELDAAGLVERTRVTGFLPYASAMAELASASVAVIAGPTDEPGILAGHVVAKTWEYLATDLPILYVGSVETDAARLLALQDGATVASPADSAVMTRALQAAAAGARHARDASAFSRRTRAKALAGLLDRVTTISR